MNRLFALIFFLPFPSLWADSSAAYPPNPYETEGIAAPTYSEANAAAIHFLNLVDNQAYGGAWGDGSPLLHDTVPQNIWAAGLREVRMHLGTVRARKVTGHQASTVLPGGTKGNFMTITYATQFARHPMALEVVTLMMHPPAGQWKVISYRLDVR